MISVRLLILYEAVQTADYETTQHLTNSSCQSRDGIRSGQQAPVDGRVGSVFWPVLVRKIMQILVSEQNPCPRKHLQTSTSPSLLIYLDLIGIYEHDIRTYSFNICTALFHLWHDSIWSKFCRSTGQSRSGQRLKIFASWLAGRLNRRITGQVESQKSQPVPYLCQSPSNAQITSPTSQVIKNFTSRPWQLELQIRITKTFYSESWKQWRTSTDLSWSTTEWQAEKSCQLNSVIKLAI